VRYLASSLNDVNSKFCILFWFVKRRLYLMMFGCSLPCSQNPTVKAYPKPAVVVPHLHYFPLLLTLEATNRQFVGISEVVRTRVYFSLILKLNESWQAG
jgi:hypothetical protein